jgi:hypothetical protein
MTSKMDTGVQQRFYGGKCKENLIGNGACTNSGFNYGNSSKLAYDVGCIKDSIQQSTAPIQSTMDPNRIRNCKQCLSLNGPRASYMGWAGDSLPIASAGVSPFNQVIDVDSIMSNRNVKQERTKKGKVNPVDINKFKLYDSPECNHFLDPLNTTLTTPKQLYREMSINRFYNQNLPNDKPIFWNFEINSRLQAADNFDNPYPYSVAGNVEPDAIPSVANAQPSPYPQNGVPVLMTNLAINSPQTPIPITNGFSLYNRMARSVNDSDSESGNSTDNEM